MSVRKIKLELRNPEKLLEVVRDIFPVQTDEVNITLDLVTGLFTITAEETKYLFKKLSLNADIKDWEFVDDNSDSQPITPTNNTESTEKRISTIWDSVVDYVGILDIISSMSYVSKSYQDIKDYDSLEFETKVLELKESSNKVLYVDKTVLSIYIQEKTKDKTLSQVKEYIDKELRNLWNNNTLKNFTSLTQIVKQIFENYGR